MADPAIAANSEVVIDYENGWGVAKTAGTYDGRIITVVSDNLLGTQELLDNPSIRSDFNPSAVVSGKQSASGSIVLVPNVDVMAMLAEVFLHNRSTSAGPPYTHTSKLGAFTTPMSMQVQTKFVVAGNTRYKRGLGVRINRMSIPINPDGFLQVTLDCAAKSVAIDSTDYDIGGASRLDWTTGSPLEMLQVASTVIEIAGSDVGYIASGTLDFSSNLFTDDYRIGSAGARGSLVPQRYSIGGSLKLALDSTDILTLLSAGTASTFRIRWIVDGSNKFFEIDLDEIYVQKTQAPLQDGPLFVDATIKGVYDSGQTTAVRMLTANANAATVYA